ncbi:MAG: GerW family sporulation protein [Clostridia bacterium]|nr:GerW family sporulation protein [Clostridia bacterium]
MPHPIENIMHSTMEELRSMVDVNTIVGTPIIAGEESVLLPISKVSLGFVSGGGEYNMKSSSNSAPIKKAGEALDGMEDRYPFAGTAIAGMSLTPMGFVSMNKGTVKVLPAQFETTLDRAVELVPEALTMLTNLIKKKGSGSNP